MDQRAQISVEYILLVALILIIVLVFAVVITNENEQNNVATAAQLGAANATANIVFTNTTQSPVKVTSVTMTNGNTIPSNINIVIHFSRDVTSQQQIILGSINNSIVAAGFKNTTVSSSSVVVNTKTGSGNAFHTYTITLG
jgi:uncharacterized protein (UPF0333 family)